jgi:aminopeptidase YwaD
MSTAEYSSLRTRLYEHLNHLVRDRSPYFASAGHFYVQHYLQQTFAEWETVESFPFKVNGHTHQNWILNLNGQQPHRPLVLIGAHYDSVPGSPGADDNATGVAVLLEIAKALTEVPPRSPVRLVAFDLEEYGLSGSRGYAQHLHQQSTPLRLMLSLEMLGYCCHTPHSQRYPAGLQYFYPNQGNFIALIGQGQSIPDMVRLWAGFRKVGLRSQWLPIIQQGRIVPDTRRSDHAPFWDLGYPAIMVTDTADLRNPHYHQTTDTLDTLDLEFLTKVCQGLIHSIRHL